MMTDIEFEAFFEQAMRLFQALIVEIEAETGDAPIFSGDAAAL